MHSTDPLAPQMGCCPVPRRKLIRTSTLNLATGESTAGVAYWQDEACNTPLFGADRERGICRSCASGWTHEHNYPITPDMAPLPITPRVD